MINSFGGHHTPSLVAAMHPKGALGCFSGNSSLNGLGEDYFGNWRKEEETIKIGTILLLGAAAYLLVKSRKKSRKR